MSNNDDDERERFETAISLLKSLHQHGAEISFDPEKGALLVSMPPGETTDDERRRFKQMLKAYEREVTLLARAITQQRQH